MSIPDFKLLVNHHLNETEWRYETDPSLSDPILSRATVGSSFDEHPVWILGPHRGGKAEGADAVESGFDDPDILMSGPA